MEVLEKKAEDKKVEGIEAIEGMEGIALREIKAMSIKTPTYKQPVKEVVGELAVYDMAEYSCDAVCDNCHCATY